MQVDALPAPVLAKIEHQVKPLMGVELPDPVGWFVLVLPYKRPEQTRSGLYLPDKTTDEDIIQSTCGVVLAVGPMAFRGDRYGDEPWCKPGDMITWPSLATTTCRVAYNGVVLSTITDDSVRLVNADPDAVLMPAQRGV